MVTVRKGDLLKSSAQTLVNTVNCVGIMGKGVALAFKQQFPDMFKDYVRRCEGHEVQLGKPYLYKRVVRPWIINFPTKGHWRSVSHLDDIVEGLCYLEAHIGRWGIESLAMPPLGCGQGQLDWAVVGPTLYRHLKGLKIPVELYAPLDAPSKELSLEFLDHDHGQFLPKVHSYRVQPGWVAVVRILYLLDREPYHWPIGRIAFQKIAYFATEAGIPTGLSFAAGSFGPHAADLKHQIAALVNNGLVREEQVGRMFTIRVGPTFADAEQSYKQVLSEWEPAIEKIADLFMRMDTQQAETAASVHYAAHHLIENGAPPSEREVVEAVMKWKIRRTPPLDPKEVAVTIRHLNLLSWLSARVTDDLIEPEDEAMYA